MTRMSRSMSQPPITLQCPTCAGLFITLHHGSGPLETCPHCALSVARERFHPTGHVPNPGDAHRDHSNDLNLHPDSPTTTVAHSHPSNSNFENPDIINPPGLNPLEPTDTPISVATLLLACLSALALGCCWMLSQPTSIPPTAAFHFTEIPFQKNADDLGESAITTTSFLNPLHTTVETIFVPWIPSLADIPDLRPTHTLLDLDPIEENSPSTAVALVEAMEVFDRTLPLEQRLSYFHQAEKHRHQIERFFQKSLLDLASLANPSAIPVNLLPGKQKNLLFGLPTTLNRHGALVHFHHTGNDKPLIHWPLFRQSHDLEYESFLSQSRPRPGWFHLVSRLTHDFELPAILQTSYLTLQVRGSALPDSSHLLVARDTPAGRYIASQMEWDENYLIEVFVTFDSIGGKARPFIMEIKSQ
jgi:hypothetical protein